MPRAVQERLIRLWASPQGAAKAALAGAGLSSDCAMDRNPGGLLQEGVAKIGDTSVAWEGNKPVVTFPIPGVSGATATATLDDRFMAERVVVKQGSTTTEFDYSNYDDWNNPLNKIESYYAGKLVERRNGTVVRDLTTTETETGSVYVVMPVPASVGKAPGFPLLPSDRTVALASTAETPRMDNGKPDLTGNWGGGGMNWRYGNRRCAPTQLEGCSPAWNQTLDFEFEAPSRFGPNRPLYKPEHWDKVIALDMWTNKEDPVMTCQPLGIPRQGPPRRIIQSANDVVFFYGQYGDGGGGQAEFRIIPTDGRERNERDGRETKYYGYTIGKWEGDTLVLDVDLVQRLHVARARRLLPLGPDARRREAHAQGRRDPVRGDGRGSRRAARALGHDPEDSEGHAGARQARSRGSASPSAATAKSTSSRTSRRRFATSSGAYQPVPLRSSRPERHVSLPASRAVAARELEASRHSRRLRVQRGEARIADFANRSVHGVLHAALAPSDRRTKARVRDSALRLRSADVGRRGAHALVERLPRRCASRDRDPRPSRF